MIWLKRVHHKVFGVYDHEQKSTMAKRRIKATTIPHLYNEQKKKKSASKAYDIKCVASFPPPPPPSLSSQVHQKRRKKTSISPSTGPPTQPRVGRVGSVSTCPSYDDSGREGAG